MRLIDADKLALKLRYMGYMDEHEEVQEVIDSAPTVDVVNKEKYETSQEVREILVEFADDLLAELKERLEVVRCKDCKYSKHLKQYPKVSTLKCTLTDAVYLADDFCSYGERKNED